MPPTFRLRSASAMLALALATTAGRASADVGFDVSLDTSALVANPGEGSYSIDFTLIGTQGNTAAISDIQLGAGGSPTGVPVLTGLASGDLGSGVVLTDDLNNFFNDFNQTFTPGDTLTFHVVVTTAFDVGMAPDNFSFSILTPDGLSFPTTDALGSTLMNVDLTGSSPSFNTFQADTTQNFSDGAPVFPLAAPSVTVTPVPEPSSLALAVVGLAGLATLARSRGR